MDLVLRDLREEAAETLSSLPVASSLPLARDVSRDDLLKDVGSIALALHTIAAAELLIEGKPQGFFLNLCRAAENWRRLLAYLASTGALLPPASRSAPLLGAIAAGDWDRARDVARLSSTAWQDGEEYEDDFAWTQLLHQQLLGASPDALAKAAAEVRRVGEDSYGDRLTMLEALWAGDAAAFLDAFQTVWSAHAEETESAAASPGTSAVEFAPYRYLWLEGLAYLRLAEQRGLDVTAVQLRYCPALARVSRTAELQPSADDWLVRL